MVDLSFFKPQQYSPVRRNVGTIWFMLEVLLFAGIHFGWPNLVPVLKSDGIFSCEWQSTTQNSSFANASGCIGNCSRRTCREQDEKLAAAFQMCNAFAILSNVPCGILLDHFGVRVVKWTASAFFLLGCFSLAFLTSSSGFLVYLGLCSLGMSSGFLYNANMHIADSFGRRRYLVITAISGAFSSSSAVFLLVKLAYQNGLSRVVSFATLGSVGTLSLVVTTFVFLPRFKFDPANLGRELARPGRKRRDASSARSFLDDPNRVEEHSETVLHQTSTPDATVVTTGDDKKQSWMSGVCKWFRTRYLITNLMWFILIWLTLLNYYSTINAMMLRSVDSSSPDREQQVDRLISVLALANIASLLLTPVGGMLTDFMRTKAEKVCYFLVAVRQRPGTAGSSSEDTENRKMNLAGESDGVHVKFTEMVAILPSITLGSVIGLALSITLFFSGAAFYVSVVLVVLFRCMGMGTFVSFCFMIFPRDIFGKMVGFTLGIAGIVTLCNTFLQTGLLEATDRYEEGGWDGYITLRIFHLLLTILSFVHPLQVFLSVLCHLRKEKRRIRSIS